MELSAFAECPGVAGGYLISARELANCYDRAFGECPEYPTASEKGYDFNYFGKIGKTIIGL